MTDDSTEAKVGNEDGDLVVPVFKEKDVVLEDEVKFRTALLLHHHHPYQLHITMSYQHRVHVLKTKKNLTEKVTSFLFRENALVFDVLGKVACICKLDEQVHVIVDLKKKNVKTLKIQKRSPSLPQNECRA